MAQTPYNAPVGLSHAHIAAAGTLVVKSVGGFLGSIIVNSVTATTTLTVYDNTAGSGTVVAVIDLATTTIVPQRAEYGVNCTTGLTVVMTGTADVTITYR